MVFCQMIYKPRTITLLPPLNLSNHISTPATAKKLLVKANNEVACICLFMNLHSLSWWAVPSRSDYPLLEPLFSLQSQLTQSLAIHFALCACTFITWHLCTKSFILPFSISVTWEICLKNTTLFPRRMFLLILG